MRGGPPFPKDPEEFVITDLVMSNRRACPFTKQDAPTISGYPIIKYGHDASCLEFFYVFLSNSYPIIMEIAVSNGDLGSMAVDSGVGIAELAIF